MYPDQDTILQLLPSQMFVCLFVCFAVIVEGQVQIYNKALNVWFLGKLVSFVFPQVLKHQDSLENKTNCFSRDHT